VDAPLSTHSAALLIINKMAVHGLQAPAAIMTLQFMTER
jgi:hypothetical protein